MMTEPQKYQRKFARAPLLTDFIFVFQQHVFRSQVKNISIGGLLLKSFPTKVDDEDIFFMLNIPRLILLKDIMLFDLPVYLSIQKSEMIRGAGSIRKRPKSQQNDLDIILKDAVVEFEEINPTSVQLIEKYLHDFKQNIQFMLSYFDNMDKNSSEHILHLKLMAELNQMLIPPHLEAAKEKLNYYYNNFIS